MNQDDTSRSSEPYEHNDQLYDLLTARVVLHDIRGDLYRYVCTPGSREGVKSAFYDKFSLLQSLTASWMQAGLNPDELGTHEDFCTILTRYEDFVYDALDDTDAGKEHEIIASLDNGSLYRTHRKIDEFLSAGISSSVAGSQASRTDAMQAQITALFTIIEIIGAIAVLFPGVFVSIGVPATLAKSVGVLNQVQKLYPGVQLVLDRKNEIMILVGTMAAFAGGMQKNAARLVQQMAQDENMQNIMVVDETGNTIPASELVQYACDLEACQKGLEGEGTGNKSSECQKEPSSVTETDQDMFQKLTRFMDTIIHPVGKSIKTVDQVAHPGIQARIADVSRGKEFVLQVPLTLSDVGVHVGTDISAKIRELSEKVGSITGKDETDNEKDEK